MANLVERLLENSSSSQLSQILNGYLETAESKRDGDFFCSLKSVLQALKERNEISHEVTRRITHEFCLQVLTREKFTDRQKMHSVHELIVVCCAIGPENLVQEIISNCLDTLASSSNELASPTGLPVVCCLDLIGYLMKEELKIVVGDESRDKLFQSLLDVLCKSDELMCARISSSILPLFLSSDDGLTQHRLQTLWLTMKATTETKPYSNNVPGSPQVYYASMCSLIDVFLKHHYSHGSSAAEGILHDPKFWELIQQGLQLQDPLSSKRAMYLLKRALDHIDKQDLCLEVITETNESIFYWDSKLKQYWLDVWQEFVLLIETFNETQVHVIKPVLARICHIVAATETKNTDSQPLHISWLTTVYHKASLHPNRCVRKWSVLEVLSMDLTKSPLLYPQNWDNFLLGHFQSALNKYDLYGKDHDGIPGTFSPVGTALIPFYRNCLDALPKELHVEFLSKLITSIEQQHFSPAPIVFVFYALSEIPSSHLLGAESLQRIRNVLMQLRTHTINLRLATKGLIIATAANLTDPTLVTWDIVFNFLATGRLEECLQRGSWLWRCLCKWIWKKETTTLEPSHKSLTLEHEYQHQGLFQFLEAKLDNYLTEQESHQSSMNEEAPALGQTIITAADSFHDNRDNSIDPSPFVSILDKIMQNFHDARTRLYMSETRLSKTVTVLTAILQVLSSDAPYRSTNGLADSLPGDSKDQSRDLTRGLVSQSLKQALADILNLLQRKLTTCQSKEASSSDFVYLQLSQSLHRFYTANPSMRSTWQQFCNFLENVTRSNIKIIQDLQDNSNHRNQEWSTLQQSMLFVAWICDVIRNDHVTIPKSILELLLDAAPTFKLNVKFSKPETTLSAPGDVPYQDAAQSTFMWGNSVSRHIGALWTTVGLFLQHSTAINEPSRDHDVISVTSPYKEILAVALEGLDVTTSDNVIPILHSIGLLIPRLLDEDVDLCSNALDIVWGTLKSMWEDASFWEVYRTTMAVLMSPTVLMLPGDHPLTTKIQSHIEELISEGEFRPGLMNVVVQQLSDVWTADLSSSSASSMLVYGNLIVEVLLYNAAVQKTHLIDAHVDSFLRHDLSTESPLCALSSLDRRDDAQVRVMMTNIMLSLDTLSHHKVLVTVIRDLLVQDNEISVANRKMYANSRSHRRKNRAWQAILVLLSLVFEQDPQGACAEEILRCTFASLEDSNQISVQNFQQWVILYILARYPDMTSILWENMEFDSDKKVGRICFLSTITMLLAIHCVIDPMKRARFFKRAISAVFPWSTSNHRLARVYAQTAVQKMWYCCVCENIELVLSEKDMIEPCLVFMATINDTLSEKVKILENYFFFDFNPIQDFTMETIYHTIPKHAGISEEEWVAPEEFQETPLGMRVWKSSHCHGIPLRNEDRLLAEFVVVPYNYRENAGVQFQRRLRREQPPTKTKEITKEASNEVSECAVGNVQKKIIAWKIVPPDETMMIELQQQRMIALQKSSGGNLIVVASLIDKAPNLGGLCRTSEIFGVRKLVLGSNEIMKDQQFKSLSVSSSKWVDIEQVRSADLKDYLQKMRRQGYTLIGVEQTANSKPLTEYTFPHDALLLLGNEKEGIPADLIQLLDECVEIPQVGIIRSLNVHVSGALLIWEYTRQRVLSVGNTAD